MCGLARQQIRHARERAMRPDMYLDAMKELGVAAKVAEQQKATLFDSTLDGSDPEKYALSFQVHSVA